RPFTAACTTARTTDINMRLLLRHHVDQQTVANVLVIRRAHLLEIAMALANIAHEFFGLGNHLQCIIVAYRHALRASLALRRIDEDAKNGPFALLFLLAFIELARLGPLLFEERPIGFGNLADLLLPFTFRKNFS